MSKKSMYSLAIFALGLVLTNVAKSDDPGWPVNCVKLSPGQTITIDGVVTPQEYNGAQELIINDQTVDAPDPHLPYVHNAKSAADDDPSLDDFSVTYYFMWDDQFLYVAATATDDINQRYGTTPNHMDCLQFCLAASPQEQVQSQIAIPTVAPADGNGNILAKTDFGGFLPAQVAEESEIAGGVDPDTQDWVLEMAIPWDNLIGDFSADLAQGDSDGNGRNVFPPYPGDVVGFVAFGIDVDSDTGYSFFYCTHNSFPWEGAGLGELRFVEPTGGIGMASRPSPSDGALIEETWVTLSWWPGNFAVSHDVYLGDNFDDVNDATKESELFRGNQVSTLFVAGFPGFAYPDGLVPGSTYYWRIDEVNDADPNSPWKGLVWSFSIPPKTAYNPDPADGTEFVGPDDVTLSWTPGHGAKLHTVYLGDDYDEVNDATVGVPSGAAHYNPGPLESEKVYYWRIDEFDGIATYKGDIWGFTTPGAVGNPQPTYDAEDVAMNTILSWTPADSAASHQLYLGTDKAAVRGADTGSPEYKGSKTLGAESHDPGLLDADTTYYWRVDEVDAQGNTAKGPLWIFTTGNFLLIDDFEGYTDNDAAGEAIWQTWVDGFGVADNGAQVGYLLPPYAEQSIVHGGAQSMPIVFANEAGVTNSEASLTLTAPRDWTQANVAELSLWIRGISTNAADPLYVSLSNTAGAPAVVAHDNLKAAQKGIWTQWIIPLQAFTDQGINLSNVDKIAIGLGTKAGAAGAGGTGKMYIDDIRLNLP